MLENTIMKVFESLGNVNYLIPDSFLAHHCELIHGSKISDHQFQQTISKMINEGQVAMELDPVSSEPRYKMEASALT